MTRQLLSDYEIYLFHEGRNFRSYRTLGAHEMEFDGAKGVRFAVWAPHALAVRVIGDFNGWDGKNHSMRLEGSSGIWALFIPGLKAGDIYKYEITTQAAGMVVKADPFAFGAELRPKSASRITRLTEYAWQDEAWRQTKREHLNGPVLIYEVHLGSWRRGTDNRWLTYRELAEKLVQYVVMMGYTHIEILPLAEHPYDGSWGYQATGYYALTSRYGAPEDFMYFVDCCHRHGIGVILDWVPGHFCNDGHGLKCFDGMPLFESNQAWRSENYGWGTTNFDFEKPEVWSFLISNAMFWFDIYHIDGLRVDAVANMLYLDYERESGQWEPNQYGGRENLEAIAFLRKLNETVFAHFPAALMIAEESTTWPLVTRPTYVGGLGFNYKWNMGWMNDILHYMETDSVHRKWIHQQLTFSMMYAFSENFVLPMSHDEVVHGKKSLLDKMPGDYWQKFANLRAFYGYMMGHPGKKLLFMGGEFGQFIEWNENESLDWHLLTYELHAKLQHYVAALNHYYCQTPCFWAQDDTWDGFQWIDCNDYMHSVVSFVRRDEKGDFRIVVVNFTPVVHDGYRIGVPKAGGYSEELNSDWEEFGGSGQSTGLVHTEPVPWHNQAQSLVITIPPLAVVFFRMAIETAEAVMPVQTG